MMTMMMMMMMMTTTLPPFLPEKLTHRIVLDTRSTWGIMNSWILFVSCYACHENICRCPKDSANLIGPYWLKITKVISSPKSHFGILVDFSLILFDVFCSPMSLTWRLRKIDKNHTNKQQKNNKHPVEPGARHTKKWRDQLSRTHRQQTSINLEFIASTSMENQTSTRNVDDTVDGRNPERTEM